MNHCKKVILLWIVMVVGLTLSCRKATSPHAPGTGIIWEKTYGDSTYSETGKSIQRTSEGGYIVAGISFSTTGGISSVYLIKTDENGDSIWTKKYEGEATCVQQTMDGCYIVTGEVRGNDYADILLLKTDSQGNMLWSKSFDKRDGDYGYSVRQTDDGGFIIAGTTRSTYLGASNICLIRTDINGDTLWTRIYGHQIFSIRDEGFSVDVTSDSGYIVVGSTMGNYIDVYAIKTDVNGDTVWTRKIGAENAERGYSVEETTDGGFIIAGRSGKSGGDLYLIKLDSVGDSIWTRSFGSSSDDYGNHVIEDSEGKFVIAGLTEQDDILGDVYVLQASSSGDSINALVIGGDDYDIAYSICESLEGGYVAVGRTVSYGAGDGDVYLIKLKPEE